MLIYSVVVAKDNVLDDELVLETYSNKESAQEHEQFMIDSDLRIDGFKWDYVFIRETQVVDVFEGGAVDIDQSEDDERISLEEYLNDLEHDRDE
jgi:hypothetical protein